MIESFTAARRTLVDMDGVLAGYNLHIIDELDKIYPDENVRNIPLNIYHTHKNFPENIAETAKEIQYKSGFFLKLPVIQGAIEAWLKMEEAGFSPTICSAPMKENLTCKKDKISWLEENFVPHVGYSIIDEAIIQKDKVSVSGLVLIDDHPEIRGMENASWKQILFDAEYNRAIINKPRILDWAMQGWFEIVKKERG